MMSDRSPSYPGYALPQAVEFIEALYEGAHTATFGNDSAFELMGYRGKSGAALSALAALKHFGLVSGRDPNLELTNLALQIVEPTDETERAAAIHEALKRPDAFRRILEEYPRGLPSDSVIRSKLVREYNFSSTGIKRFLSSLKDSINFANRFGSFTANEKELVNSAEADQSQSGSSPDAPMVSKPKSNTTIAFPLGASQMVSVNFSETPSEKHINTLQQLLEIYKATLAEIE